ncbi:MAG: DUF1684 domain-containing protein [Flavobacteriaceae bacterium]|nr:DUF1684 domain-containing protein [Flavobacteriaceae bacterium]
MKYLQIVLIVFLLASCKKENQRFVIDSAYQYNWKAFLDSKTKERKNNYLQLIALYKIEDDTTTFGSDKKNTFVFNIDDIPKTIGSIIVDNNRLIFNASENIVIKSNAKDSIVNTSLNFDKYGSSQKIKHNRLSWQIITRSGQKYLRVWDAKNPFINAFKGYEWFELNSEFIFEAQFSYFKSLKSEVVKAEVDGKRSVDFIGKVTFIYKEESYTLDVGENGFTMVSDESSVENTYGGGRYMYLDLPETDGVVMIDFNKLYNPPCAFSEFTTCLYPPRQNVLPFKISAGETMKLIN